MKLIIEPGLSAKNYWRDLWNYRELAYFLAWRDIAVRYKQTVIGVVWALLRPALTMLVFVAFRRISGLQRGEIPDPILIFAAVLPWQFFSTALVECSNSLIGNGNLISKIYFPRLIVPCASVTTSLVDFTISFALLIVMMLFYRFAPGWPILMLPFFIALTFVLALGFGVLLATLNVEYRDFRFVVPFMVQFGVFVSPIAFQSDAVPAEWRMLYALNPMVGVIDGFRWSILGGHTPLSLPSVAISILMAIGSLTLGIRYFRRMERTFADVI